MLAWHRDSQAVYFVEPTALHRTGLSVVEDDGFADKLGLSLFELTEDGGCADLCSWHAQVFAFETCTSRDRRAAKRCREPSTDIRSENWRQRWEPIGEPMLLPKVEEEP